MFCIKKTLTILNLNLTYTVIVKYKIKVFRLMKYYNRLNYSEKIMFCLA